MERGIRPEYSSRPLVSPALECRDVRERRLCDRAQRLPREEALVPGDEDVGERQQPREHIVLNDLRGEILKKQAFFLLVDVDRQ